MRYFLVFAATMFASVASAHPGHAVASAHEDNSWMHYVTQPAHAGPLLVLLLSAVLVVRVFSWAIVPTHQPSR